MTTHGGFAAINRHRAAERSIHLRALGASVGLSVLFLVVYGWCNWFTVATAATSARSSSNGNVSSRSCRSMIVPYMSIDLFFVAAPFLCRSERELATLSQAHRRRHSRRRNLFSPVPAALRLRTPARRRLARRSLRLVSRNGSTVQSASLAPHRALRTILARHYARHTRGLVRHASNIWFVLIGLSAVLTYQHHVMDVVGGFALGVYCLYFIRESEPRLAGQSKTGESALYYGLGALLIACLVVLLLALGRVAALAGNCSWALRPAPISAWVPGFSANGDGRLPWSARLGARSVFVRPAALPALLSPGMPRLG